MKPYVYFLSIILFCIPFRGHSQENKNIKYDLNGNIKYIKFDEELESSMGSINSSIDFFNKILGIKTPNSFLLKNRITRKDGSYYESYRQYYDTIEVEGGIFILHFRDGNIKAANGHLVGVNKINIIPSLIPEQAYAYYLKYLGSAESDMPKFFHRLLISEFENITDQDTMYSTRLCYTIQILNSTFGSNEVGYIDAHTGEVLKTEDTFNFYSFVATFDTTMYSNYRNAITEYYSGNYILKDSSHDAVIHTWDLNNDNQYNYSNRVEFIDNDNLWLTYEHDDDYDMVAEDIHWGLILNYEYYYDNFGFSSFDNNDMDIDAYVHVVFRGLEASTDNAAYVKFENGYQALFFGDGGLAHKPWGSLDLVSHEYAHGITANHTYLSNDKGEEQSIKEGFSDIWGVVIEDAAPYNANDTDKECWKIGEEIINVSYHDCMRNIADPKSHFAEIQMADTYGDSCYTKGNFYVKSGVMSHWFYLLAEGGNDINGNDDEYLVYGLGIEDAAKIVFEGQTGHFANVNNYSEAREAMIDASDEIFSDLESMQVANAWYAVGVGSKPDQIGITGSSSIYPYGIKFTLDNVPNDCEVLWECSNNISLSDEYSNPVVVSSNGSGSGWIKATVSSDYTEIELDKVNVTVYSSNPYITGSSLVCSSGATFGLSAACSYDSIKWIAGSNLNITSGQGTSSCTFAATGSSSSDINVTLYVNGNGTNLSEKEVWAGKPVFNSISGPNPPYVYKGCAGQPYTFWANPARDPLSQASYTWMVQPGYLDWYFQYQYYDWVTIVFDDPYDYYQVIARATNTCGQTYWVYKNVEIMDCYYFSMYPNPASDYVTLTLTVPDTDTDFEMPSYFKVQIIDNAGMTYYSAIKSGDSFTIPVNNLKNGNYLVSITFGNKIENLPLIVKH